MDRKLMLLCFAAGIFFGGMVGLGVEVNQYRSQAIERGYALYCPNDGAFAWKGECDDTRN